MCLLANNGHRHVNLGELNATGSAEVGQLTRSVERRLLVSIS